MFLRNSLVRCDLHHRIRILPRLTGNEVVIAQIESKGAQCECEKGATGRQRTWRPVANARFRGREVTGRAFTLPMQEKIA